ncbi:MAG TPA: ATP-grasp domain-containing protein [Rhizomicrobium sp.]|jgi:D-alanine-D-alanine ligase|nr:ATP-grasp domain-containing protein [Rhizomicrobium sp.]
MRVLVLHSDVPPDAPVDEQDTLITARAARDALQTRGYTTELATFVPSPDAFRAILARAKPDVVFNLTESVFGLGQFAPVACQMLEISGVPFTGTYGAPMAMTGDKPLTKGLLRAAGLPTPDWSEPPHWSGLDDNRSYIVKHATEDASIGLDDGAVVSGREAIAARAKMCAQKYGGRWFAEAFVEGREFNIAVLEEGGQPRVLPLAEMRFENWPQGRPTIVGYSAKWDESALEYNHTVRAFGVEKSEPKLAAALRDCCERAWKLFGLAGFARVDFRVDANGSPLILEINPNPGLEPEAGFAAAAREAGMDYPDVVERILKAALA